MRRVIGFGRNTGAIVETRVRCARVYLAELAAEAVAAVTPIVRLKSKPQRAIDGYQCELKCKKISNPNTNPTFEHHAVVNIQLNSVACPAYPEKFI